MENSLRGDVLAIKGAEYKKKKVLNSTFFFLMNSIG